jgi:uncharacterized membrane protein YeaQ/YmgE (transglycosylase-associated protein family)
LGKYVPRTRLKAVSIKGFIGFQENGINPYIWCVVGALLGGAACLLAGAREKILILESIGVGMFGAFIGGDFVASLISHGKTNDTVFNMSSLGMAVGGAVAALGLLRLMRRAVGPQHVTKGPRRRD